MGSIQLECPLCCSETFSTHTSLKYHLLSMIDNLLCTVCGQKYNTIRELAEHLTNDCKVIEDDNKNDDESVINEATSSELEEDEQEMDETIEELDIKQELKIEDEEDVFYCSSCAVSFVNVDDHLNTFHQGQQVIVEEGDAQGVEEVENAENSFILGEEVEGMSLQTIKEEDCLDKSGRIYTRKVVQIEKFWDNKTNVKRPEPITQHFHIVEGKAVKISETVSAKMPFSNDILKVYQCPMCAVHFTKQKQYDTHKCTSMKFHCKECDASFAQSRSLSAHMRIHNSKTAKPLKVTPNALNKSLNQSKFDAKCQSGENSLYICPVCKTSFTTYKSLRLHSRMHDPVKNKEIEAPVNYGIMGEGIDDEESSERPMFVCTVCDKPYDLIYEEIHMRSHVDEEKFDCEICNRKFHTQANLEMHARVHQTEKKHSCNYCKKGFEDVKELEEHIKEHIESRPYECQYCGRRFIRPHEKVKHERIHTGEKPHVCEICGKSFRVSYCLTLHMRTHSGSRPYQCKECGKRFKAHSVYNHHLMIHSNARNYKCPYCPKAFKTGVQLAGHKNTHTKPFTCTECNRPFASLYAVRSHMETHKTDNNLKYNCYACGASYARAFALRDHVNSHHKDDMIESAEFVMLEESNNATNSILPDEDVEEDAETQNVVVLEQNPLQEHTIEMQVEEMDC